MNAVIALCHFCEVHGPSPVLCTQSLKETRIEEINFNEIEQSNKLCPACNSIGSCGIITKDESGCTSFLTTQTPIFVEVSKLLKQASVRSLSCEISATKDGGFVFFGDTINGHILSHTFHISDLQARGFFQLFSIIILMKDKYYLLNIKNFFAKYMSKISSELKELAKTTCSYEKARSSPLKRRISADARIMSTSPRSLINLTNQKDIFEVIHINFTRILLAGSKYLTEAISIENLNILCNSPQIFEYVHNINTWDNFNKETGHLSEKNINGACSLRHIKDVLGFNFVRVCFCVLTGINLLLRGPYSETSDFIEGLKTILPHDMHKIIKINSSYDEFLEYKIVSVQTEVAVPIESSSIFRIDFYDNQIKVKWLGDMPNKCWYSNLCPATKTKKFLLVPTLLLQIIKAVDEVLFTDFVLKKRLIVLVEEWRNKVLYLSKIKSTRDAIKLKKIFGILPQDQILIQYWLQYM